MTRIVPVIVLVVSLVTSRGARAQTTTGMLPNNANIVFEHRAIFDLNNKEQPFFEPQSGDDDLLRYFNLARCNCARAAFNSNTSNTAGTFHYLVRETQQSLLHVSVDYYTGTNCDQAPNRPGGNSVTCAKLTRTSSNSDLDANLYPGGVVKDFNLYEVVNGTKADGVMSCNKLDSANNSIYALVDTSGATNYNYSSSVVVGKLDGEANTGSGTDTKPPSLPMNLQAFPGEGEIDLSWDPPSSNSTDIVAYQALCATVDGNIARSSASHTPRYVTTAVACPGVNVGMDADVELPTKIPLDNDDTPITALNPSALNLLDAKFVCGETSSGTATSMAIKDLQNGLHYQVVLLAIDRHGNFSAAYFDHAITPVPVTDFWEVLHERGSQADGGLCLMAETYGDDSGLTRTLRAFRDDTLGRSRIGRSLIDVYYATLGKLGHAVHGSLALRVLAGVLLAPLVGFALLWHWLTLPGALVLFALLWWLRRRPSAVARRAVRRSWYIPGLATGALIFLGGGLAHAGGYQPYWDDAEQLDQAKAEVPLDDPSLVTWHAGLRLGPFIPDIDSQVSVSPAPYEQMFGGYHMLTMLDVHRIVWTGFGQIGVGGSIGYWQKTARPFIDGADLTKPNPERQPGNKTAFRIVPTELTATYRFTVLDDDYGIPVVPYVRGGLAYYIWWMTAPSGNLSRVCDSTGTMCGSKALGASLGVTGAIGLAIRAERVDAAAAMSMRQSGIQHAGIYAELSLAKVDGFGSDKKLSVGDRTWFAGIDFEF